MVFSFSAREPVFVTPNGEYQLHYDDTLRRTAGGGDSQSSSRIPAGVSGISSMALVCWKSPTSSNYTQLRYELLVAALRATPFCYTSGDAFGHAGSASSFLNGYLFGYVDAYLMYRSLENT